MKRSPLRRRPKAPWVRINRILGSSVGLVCGHVALRPRPLSNVFRLAVRCYGCLEGRPTDHEYAEAALLNETQQGLGRLHELLAGRLAARAARCLPDGGAGGAA